MWTLRRNMKSSEERRNPSSWNVEDRMDHPIAKEGNSSPSTHFLVYLLPNRLSGTWDSRYGQITLPTNEILRHNWCVLPMIWQWYIVYDNDMIMIWWNWWRYDQWRSQEVEVEGAKSQTLLPFPLPSSSPPLPLWQLGVRWSAVSCSSGVWGGAPAASDFGAF